MKSTYGIIFFIRRDKLRKTGKAPLSCRITINGGITSMSVNLEIEPSIWNVQCNRAIGKSDESKYINNMISSIEHKFRIKYDELTLLGVDITAEILKLHYLGKFNSSNSLVVTFNKFLIRQEALKNKNKLSEDTYKRNRRTLDYLKEYLRENKRTDIAFNQIKLEFIEEFEIFLRTKKNCDTNTTCKYMQEFKRVVKIALDNGYIIKSPFLDYDLQKEKRDRGYLTQTEIETIYNKEISIPRLELIRDMFIFSCYTGLAYDDVKALKYDAIVYNDLNKKLWIDGKRVKTGSSYYVPLLDIPHKIIEKYKGKSKGDHVLPILSNQKTNAYLKEIADLCSIHKNLTFHIARHSESVYHLTIK